MKDYYEISVKINPSAIELVTDVFFAQFECEGVVQAEEKWKDLELIETTNNVAKGYVLIEPEDFSPAEIQKIFDEAKNNLKEAGFTDEELGEWSAKAQKIINQDWSKKVERALEAHPRVRTCDNLSHMGRMHNPQG